MRVQARVRADHRTAAYGTPIIHGVLRRVAIIVQLNLSAAAARALWDDHIVIARWRGLLGRRLLLGVHQGPTRVVVSGIGLRGLRHLRRQSGLLVMHWCLSAGLDHHIVHHLSDPTTISAELRKSRGAALALVIVIGVDNESLVPLHDSTDDGGPS